jgi:hypothetical protein
MELNRRHKVILFMTMGLSGTRLLAGAEPKEILALFILGAALAWAIGSHLAARSYSGLSEATSPLYVWARVPLTMMLAGMVLAPTLFFSHENIVVTLGVMSGLGIVIAPLNRMPRDYSGIRVLSPVLGIFLAYLIIYVFSTFYKDEDHIALFWRTAIYGFIAMLVGMGPLSKAWSLIVKGIAPHPAENVVLFGGANSIYSNQYASLFFGLVIIAVWVAGLVWLSVFISLPG